MKFCVSGRQPYSVLKQADEIKLAANDKDIIYDFIEKIPNKTIILNSDGYNFDKDYNFYQMCLDKFDSFIVEINNLECYKFYQEKGIPWFWSYALTSYVELELLVRLKPAYIRIAAPLSFDLETLHWRTNGIPLRLVANEFGPDYLFDTDPIRSQWIRPEDVKVYGKYVDILEFKTSAEKENSLKTEEVLFRVFTNQEWNGNLRLLFPEIGRDIDNRAIISAFGDTRTVCGQRCYQNKSCHLCENAFWFANFIKKEKESWQEEMKQKSEQ